MPGFLSMKKPTPGSSRQYEKKPILKKRITYWPFLGNAVLQPAVFTLLYYLYSFVDRVWYGWLPPLVFGLFASTCLGVLLYNTAFRRKRSAWLAFTAMATFLAAVLGLYFGNVNFGIVSDYQTYKGMATYVNVNPSLDRGEGFADAADVYFKEGTTIDYARAVAFKNTDLFCVAPIIKTLDKDSGPENVALPTLDWWAVGRDCCNPSGEGFACLDSPALSRSGLRELSMEDRQFYEFAVHQFTAKYGIHAEHPLFFHYVTDPLTNIGALMLRATMNFHLAASYYVPFGLLLCTMAHLSIYGLGSDGQ